MGLVSYARNFEDVLLHRVFGGLPDGFYLDAGAGHPTAGSVTRALYDRGWSGINIEAGPAFPAFAAARPRDVNLCVALPGTETLSQLAARHGSGRAVSLVRVAADGAEAAIVQGTDWRHLRPAVLLISATRPGSNELNNQDWEPALLGQGYLRAYFDGITCFYLPEEHRDLLRHFAVPVNVLDGFSRSPDAAEPAPPAIARMVRPWLRLAADKPASPDPTPAPPRLAWMRRLVRLGYKPIRPAVRPMAWRARGFLTEELRAELRRLDQTMQDALTRPVPPPSAPDLAELQQQIEQFGRMLEATLLTLALDRNRRND